MTPRDSKQIVRERRDGCGTLDGGGFFFSAARDGSFLYSRNVRPVVLLRCCFELQIVDGSLGYYVRDDVQHDASTCWTSDNLAV